MRRLDAIIVGHGIAGATLGWTLEFMGKSVAVIDAGQTITASKIAAGLITPRTGPKLSLSWKWLEYWEAGQAFYRSVEAKLEIPLLVEAPALRLFPWETERKEVTRYLDKQKDLVEPLDFSPAINRKAFDAEFGGIEQPSATRLLVESYLQSHQTHLFDKLQWFEKTLNLVEEVSLSEDGVRIPSLGLEADYLVLCQGYQSGGGDFFQPVNYQPAKGQMLIVEVPGLEESRVIHGGIWMAREFGTRHRYRVGATFEWEQLNSVPTEAGRVELETRLREVLNTEFKVVDQVAAVRPAMRDFRPVIGLHREHRRLAIMNGLGAKGSLMAPRLAQQLGELLFLKTPLPKDVDVARWYR